MIDMRVNSHKRETINEKDEAVERALEMIGLQLEGYAKEELSKPKMHADGTVRPNVDTGRLRNSITYATINSHSEGSDPAEPSDYAMHSTPEKGKVIVGTNVEYGPHLEFGTIKMQVYSFLRPALHEHLDEYKEILESQLKGAD